MELYNRVLKLRPDVNPDDFDLQDNVTDGQGPFISAWRSDQSKPTLSEINSVDDTPPSVIAFASLRKERDRLLHDTDWWASSDLVITQEQKDYRQALRDLPANAADPTDITWPEEPA